MNDPSPDLIKDSNIHQKLNESSLSHREIFHRLDKNYDGRIEVNQLIEILEKLGIENSSTKRSAIVRVSVSFFVIRYSIGICGVL